MCHTLRALWGASEQDINQLQAQMFKCSNLQAQGQATGGLRSSFFVCGSPALLSPPQMAFSRYIQQR